jgi:hypothetical protein
MARKRQESELVQALQRATSDSRGYRECEWKSDGRQCRYPATMSTNTHEGGPWYCCHHFGCDSAAFGAQVVDASRDYRHPTPEEIEAERMIEVRASLKAKGLDRQPNEDVRIWRARTSAWMRGKDGMKRFEDAA